MRNKFFYRCVCIVSVLIILIYPFSAVSQETSDAAIAVADAKRDVKFPFFWLGGGFLVATGTGCMGGSVVILASQIATPTPPVHILIGKSTEYVSFYTSTYQAEVKKARLIFSTLGCLGGSVIAAIIWADYYNVYY